MTNIGSRHESAFGMGVGAGLEMNRDVAVGAIGLATRYEIECFDRDGNLKWSEDVHNLVTNEGLNDALSKYFKGSAYSASFFVGLKGTGTAAAGDTLASHAGWTEVSGYTGNRQALVLGAVSGQSVDNTASKAEFPITGAATVAGAFLATIATGTGGTLYGVADFTTARTVENGDTLRVSVTLTAASA